MQQSVRNVCVKFKVDRLSRFRTGAHQVFTTQKRFLRKIPLTMKISAYRKTWTRDPTKTGKPGP